jgi:hypothetical protein
LDHKEESNNEMNTQETNKSNNWMHHPNLSGMDPAKLAMLQSLANQGSQKSQADMLPFLMSIMSGSTGNGMHFSSDEMSRIIEVLKIGKSQEEIARMDKMLNLLRIMR